jgi:hypothetical protein
LKGFRFVSFGADGQENPIDDKDIEDAIAVVLRAQGVPLNRASGGFVTITGGPIALAVVHQLSTLPRYRGIRIDAIESDEIH